MRCCVQCEIDRAQSRAIHSHGGCIVTVVVNQVYDSGLDVTPKTTEQNRFVRTSKSEAEVTNNKNNYARGIVLLKLTTDRHGASHGLFATAELLVVLLQCVQYCTSVYIRDIKRSSNF